MLNKAVKQNPALLAMLGSVEDEPKKEKIEKETKSKKDPKKANPKGYERHRGKGGTKPMSYYIPDDLIKLLNIKAAKEDRTKSEIVVEALRKALKDELKESKKEDTAV